MKKRLRRLRGFSLVEVVLAVGIVGFALLAIFGLFGSSLQSNNDVINQTEAIVLNKALPAFLQGKGFAVVYGYVQNPTAVTAPPPFYAYSVPVVNSGSTTAAYRAVLLPSGDPGLTNGTTSVNNRRGRLLGVYLSVSPNFPIGSVLHPQTSDLPPSASPSPVPGGSPSGYAEGVLAIQVKAYAVPGLSLAPPNGATPLTYDLCVPH